MTTAWERRLAAAAARSGPVVADVEGLVPEWMMGDDHDGLVSLLRTASGRAAFRCQMRAAGPTGWSVVTVNRHRDGIDVDVRPEVVEGRDQLTGLVGRDGLDERLALCLADAEVRGQKVAVLWLDLDHFRRINELYGRQAGDETICGLAGALQDSLRPADVLARFGSDEFIIVAPGVSSIRDARVVAERSRKVVEAYRSPIHPDVETTASVGLVLSDIADTPAGLVTNAEVASLVAKVSGRNRSDVYDDALRVALEQNQRALDRSLRSALVANDLTISYEPVIEPATGDPHLIRVAASLPGSPDLATAAATLALRHRIITSVISTAAAALVASERADTPHPRLLVPLNRELLVDNGLVAVILRALDIAELAPDRLMVEIDERILIEHHRAADETMERLTELGVGLALADFSGGSLGRQRLTESPFDHVTLTPELMAEVSEAAALAALADPITSLVGTNRVQIVGQGVDTPKRLRDAVVAGCHLVRGRALDIVGPTSDMNQARDPHPSDAPARSHLSVAG